LEQDQPGVTDKWRVSECDQAGFTDDVIDHIYNKHKLTIKHNDLSKFLLAVLQYFYNMFDEAVIFSSKLLMS